MNILRTLYEAAIGKKMVNCQPMSCNYQDDYYGDRVCTSVAGTHQQSR